MERNRSVTSLSLALAFLTAAAAAAGLFWPGTYARETPLWAVEGRGGDAVTLFVVVPVLLASALLARGGSAAALLVWMGTLVFLVYNFLIYAVAVHFNALFLVYCAVLGLSFYALLGAVSSLPPAEFAARYGPRAPVRAIAAVFFLIAFLFAAQWLGEIIPALMSGRAPKSVSEAGLLTSPVHVLDLSFVLPGFVIAGLMLLRRRPAAFVLAPVLLVFAILMTLAVAGMLASMKLNGIADDYVVVMLFAATAAACTLLLARFLRV